jgi:hypothetical protein
MMMPMIKLIKLIIDPSEIISKTIPITPVIIANQKPHAFIFHNPHPSIKLTVPNPNIPKPPKAAKIPNTPPNPRVPPIYALNASMRKPRMKRNIAPIMSRTAMMETPSGLIGA